MVCKLKGAGEDDAEWKWKQRGGHSPSYTRKVEPPTMMVLLHRAFDFGVGLFRPNRRRHGEGPTSISLESGIEQTALPRTMTLLTGARFWRSASLRRNVKQRAQHSNMAKRMLLELLGADLEADELHFTILLP